MAQPRSFSDSSGSTCLTDERGPQRKFENAQGLSRIVTKLYNYPSKQLTENRLLSVITFVKCLAGGATPLVRQTSRSAGIGKRCRKGPRSEPIKVMTLIGSERGPLRHRFPIPADLRFATGPERVRKMLARTIQPCGVNAV